MTLTINGKAIDKLQIKDLQLMLNEDDYRESEYLEYKSIYEFMNKDIAKEARRKSACEFRNDICSFANTNGGYILIGITEDNGKPTNIGGVPVKNNDTDEYELNIRNQLTNIQPKIPTVRIYFVNVSDLRYVVIIEIIADGLVPYVFVDDKEKYDFVYRDGNGKRHMSYNQVMTLFNQSLIMSDKIDAFRRSRDKYHSDDEQPPLYARMYVISADFIDLSLKKKVYLLARKDSNILQPPVSFNCIIPNVDGVQFGTYIHEHFKSIYFYDGGICELNIKIFKGKYLKKFSPNWRLYSEELWDREFVPHVKYSLEELKKMKYGRKAYLCFDLSLPIGTVTGREFDETCPVTDRQIIKSQVVEIENITDVTSLNESIRQIKIDYYLALGVRDPIVYSNIENENIY